MNGIDANFDNLGSFRPQGGNPTTIIERHLHYRQQQLTKSSIISFNKSLDNQGDL